jgi:3-dehydroquinate synthase
MKITRPKFLPSVDSLCAALQKQLAGRRFVLLTDEVVGEHCMPSLSSFISVCPPLDIIEVESGESCKSAEVCFQLWSHLLELEFSKKDVLICLGGGAICDLGGFIAATYKRGIPCIFIPTTLLAMTDASVGGKNGIDIESVKNAIGTILQPEAILVYMGFCNTLPQNQYLSGMAEVIKHGIIEGGHLWELLNSLSPEAYLLDLTILKKSVDVKLGIVRRDVQEKSLRKILNFGHTIGHAIESVAIESGQAIEHGIAVSVGMLVESHYSMSIGKLRTSDFNSIFNLIVKWCGHHYPDLPTWEKILPYIRNDKKVESKKNVLYLPIFLGCFEIFEVSVQDSMQLSYNEMINSIRS